jgi:arylsulfatase A-like enzyme
VVAGPGACSEPGAAAVREPRVLLDHTVSTPNRWEPQTIDLGEFANQQVVLTLSIAADRPGTLGLWGAPTIRGGAAAKASVPRGVILIHADTLRADHLGLYGYGRDTAPFLSRLAKEGAVFRQAFAQAGWTKVSTPSFLTSLYPTTHGVWTIPGRLPASAITIAEVYRGAGYDTVSYSSVPFTGSGANLHQGFEELHEATSVRVDDRSSPQTAREFVDRASEWIARHERAPFFMYLHVFDPHSPFEPRRPYDVLWADTAKREEHLRQRDALRKVISNLFMAERGMATRDEMIKAGVDPAVYLAHDQDWYDGSIRGLDAELARLFQRLRRMGLDRDVAVVFLADHGEEFQEHGRMWHGQSVYGEMMHVPLVVRWPAGLKSAVVDEPVELVDVMPTLLDLSGLPPPPGVQGQSLVPLLQRSDGGARGSWKRRPVIMEKQPMGEPEFPGAAESYAIIDGSWKLVVNKVRAPGQPEYELYEFPRDPLDRHDVAADHPDVVQRLAKVVDGWHTMAAGARPKADADAGKSLSPEELQRLRSLGYVK